MWRAGYRPDMSLLLLGIGQVWASAASCEMPCQQLIMGGAERIGIEGRERRF